LGRLFGRQNTRQKSVDAGMQADNQNPFMSGSTPGIKYIRKQAEHQAEN
jgi:hypothetical protein